MNSLLLQEDLGGSEAIPGLKRGQCGQLLPALASIPCGPLIPGFRTWEGLTAPPAFHICLGKKATLFL